MVQRLRFNSRPQQAGRNWVANQARTRLFDEAAKRFNVEQRNAISVHGSPIRYFSKMQTGITCSCRQHRTDIDVDEEVGVEINFRSPLHDPNNGTQADELFNDDIDLIEEPEPAHNNQDPMEFAQALFGDESDCAVCFRHGYVGGYTELNRDRKVYDTQRLEKGAGVFLDQVEGEPTGLVFEDLSANFFAEFLALIPGMFNEAEFGVFNNKELLSAQLYTPELEVIDYAWLKERAGTYQTMRVTGVSRYTHVVLNFSIPTLQLVADFPQDQVNVDYERFDNKAQQSMVVSDLVPVVQTDDVVIKIRENTFSVWSCLDATPHALENGYGMGFTVQVRSVQPDELMYRLATLNSF